MLGMNNPTDYIRDSLNWNVPQSGWGGGLAQTEDPVALAETEEPESLAQLIYGLNSAPVSPAVLAAV